METPKEHLNVRLNTLKALGGQRHMSKTKREAKRLIPVFENAIKALEEAETSKANLDIADVVPMLIAINGLIDKEIEKTDLNNIVCCNKISDIVEFIHGISEDNNMFIRN